MCKIKFWWRRFPFDLVEVFQKLVDPCATKVKVMFVARLQSRQRQRKKPIKRKNVQIFTRSRKDCGCTSSLGLKQLQVGQRECEDWRCKERTVGGEEKEKEVCVSRARNNI